MFSIVLANAGTTLTAVMLVLTACGCFLVGINLMSKGFVQASLSSNNFFVRGFAAENRFFGFGAGLMHTALVQSSDVTTVTLVRLADIGVITLFQACACIVGANVGTTLTTFIVSLSALNLTPYFAFLAFIGAIPLLSKKRKMKTFGEIVAGFGILFIGLQLLHDNIENPAFQSLMETLFKSTTNPPLLVAMATGVTMIVQSSTVVTSMVVFLVSGIAGFPLESALCLIVGANIGTCFTSWIASLGASRTARQVAMFHTLFNLIGTSIFMVVMYTPIKEPFFNFARSIDINTEFKVALFHLSFNLCAAMVMIPLLRPFVWISKKLIRR